MRENVSLTPSIVKHVQRASSVALERRVWRRAGNCCSSRSGGCCECWNVGRSGRCFAAGSRCCYGRRHKSRCGSRAGSRCDTRTGCRSGRRCRAGIRCYWGTSAGGRCEGRAWGRSVGCCSGRSGCRFRRCCGRRNRARIRGKDSPSGLGNSQRGRTKSDVRCLMSEVRSVDGGTRIVQSSETRNQNPECRRKDGKDDYHEDTKHTKWRAVRRLRRL